jgi:hypothetical protein
MLEFETKNTRYQFDTQSKKYRSSSLKSAIPIWCEWHPYAKLGIGVASLAAHGRKSLHIYLPGKDEDNPLVTTYISKYPEGIQLPDYGYIS